MIDIVVVPAALPPPTSDPVLLIAIFPTTFDAAADCPRLLPRNSTIPPGACDIDANVNAAPVVVLPSETLTRSSPPPPMFKSPIDSFTKLDAPPPKLTLPPFRTICAESGTLFPFAVAAFEIDSDALRPSTN